VFTCLPVTGYQKEPVIHDEIMDLPEDVLTPPTANNSYALIWEPANPKEPTKVKFYKILNLQHLCSLPIICLHLIKEKNLLLIRKIMLGW